MKSTQSSSSKAVNGHDWERSALARSWRCKRCGSITNSTTKPPANYRSYVIGSADRHSCEEVMVHQVMKS